MASHVLVTLDTTAPDLAVDATQDVGEPTLLTLALTADFDAAEVKVWGGIDPIDPLNGDYGESEGAATWIAYSASLQVRAAVGGAPIYVRVRDDVYNESAAILAFGTVPPPTPEEPSRGGMPGQRPARRGARRRVQSGPSRVRVQSRTAVRTSAAPGRVRTRSRLGLRSRSRDAATMSHRCLVAIHSRTTVAAYRRRPSSPSSAEVATETAIHRRPEGPNTEAALLDLDIL